MALIYLSTVAGQPGDICGSNSSTGPNLVTETSGEILITRGRNALSRFGCEASHDLGPRTNRSYIRNLLR